MNLTPELQNMMKYVDFMLETDAIKVHRGSWKAMFFDNVHMLPAS